MKILFIGARLYDDIFFYVKEKNIKSIITESNLDAPNLELADEFFIVPRGMEEPMKIAIENNVDAIIPLIGIDTPLLDVAMMKEKMEKEYNIPVIASNTSVINYTSNKIRTKEFLNKIGIDTPRFSILTKENYKDKLKFDFPFVLKQSEGQGGKDIVIAKDEDDLNSYFEKFDEALCEEYIEGSEISIEVIGYKNDYLALVPIYKGETTLEGIHPLSKKRFAPCNIENLDESFIKEKALKFASSLEIEGILEIDMIFSKNDNKLYIIEGNSRPNGIRYVTDASSGINTLIKLVDMAIGEYNSKDIKLKSYFATEIPIGVYKGPKANKPLKSFINNDFVVHGPDNYERITIRADSIEKLKSRTKELLI